ncbi:MAG: polysaccharide deacetylase family protein [Phycisphaerales bacterium]|nr:polysaccharide deacetylase family protein [Phycisphaerales bacterium]
MNPFTWSAMGVISALGAILALMVPCPLRSGLLAGLLGSYLVLLAVGALVPRLNFYLHAACRGPSAQPWVALTFDDGPDPAITPLLLELLRREGVPATFFYIGEAAQRYPALVTEAAADGHLIANHSNHHGYAWAFASERQLLAEFEAANRVLSSILGHSPRFVRTPVGISRPGLDKVLHHLRLRNIAWDVRGLEGFHRDPERISAHIADRARNGSIILLHELYYGVARFDPQQVLRTTQLTIDRLRARGFSLVHLDQLLGQAEAQSWVGNWDSPSGIEALMAEEGRGEVASATSRASRA